MIQKTTFLIISILSLGFIVVGQTDAGKSEKAESRTGLQGGAAVKPSPGPMPKQIMGGVLNGKAISLPKPAYPGAARAVGASGAVSVQVLIDEEGSILSATAVSGHPLLRATSVEAARQAKFSPTLLEGQPVKVSGIITYNYVGPFSMVTFGFEIGFAEADGSFREFIVPKLLAAQLPDAWTQEKQALQELTFEPSTEPPIREAAKPRDSANDYSAAEKFTVSGGTTVKGPNHYQTGKLTGKSLKDLRDMRSDLAARLSSDPREQWGLNAGMALGKFVAEIEKENETRINIEAMAHLAENSPLPETAQFLIRFRRFITLAQTSNLDAEKRPSLVEGALGLKGIKF